jgi:hypothetical protein
MKELYDNEKWMFTVLLDEETGNHFLEVMCGGVGLYPVRVKLSDEQIQDFRNDPESLFGLASRILQTPSEYSK